MRLFQTWSTLVNNSISRIGVWESVSKYRVSKKMSLKEMFDFLTLKMLPLALALFKTKNCHLFDPLDKIALFQWKFSLAIKNEHFLTNGSKRWQFFVLINANANGNVFRVKKSHISLRCVFLKHPVYKYLPSEKGNCY